MAENADIELTVGAIADVASITKVGQQIRNQLQQYVSDSLTSIGMTGSRAIGYLARANAASTGADIYSAIRNARNEVSGIRTRVNQFNKKYETYDPVEAQVLDSVLDTLNVATNVAKRTAVYSPINQRLAGKKAKAKADANALLSDEKQAAIELERWEKQQAAKGLEQAKLVQSLNGWDVNSRYIDYNRRAEIAEAFQAADDAEKQKQQEEKEALKENTKALKTLTVIATGVVASGIRTMAAVMPTYWQEHVDRSYWGSERARVARIGAVAKGAGEAGGSVIGGLIGSIFGPAGALVGAGIGGNLGGTIGGLYGTSKEKELEAIQKTISQVNERYRSFGIYRGQASVGYAASVADTDMASSSDVGKMVHNSATLAARMMFGQVGENEMMMYSLMPGYFAAAMSGASDAELAEAYKNDIEKLPPQLRVWAAENVGGGSLGMLAYTQSPMFNTVQAGVRDYRAYDAAMMVAGRGYATETATRAILNRQKEYNEFGVDLGKQRPKEGIWQPAGGYYETAISSKYGRGLDLTEGINDVAPGSFPERRTTRGEPIRIVNNIVVDGNVVQTEENEITEEMMRGGYSPTLTSLLGVD